MTTNHARIFVQTDIFLNHTIHPDLPRTRALYIAGCLVQAITNQKQPMTHQEVTDMMIEMYQPWKHQYIDEALKLGYSPKQISQFLNTTEQNISYHRNKELQNKKQQKTKYKPYFNPIIEHYVNPNYKIEGYNLSDYKKPNVTTDKTTRKKIPIENDLRNYRKKKNL